MANGNNRHKGIRVPGDIYDEISIEKAAKIIREEIVNVIQKDGEYSTRIGWIIYNVSKKLKEIQMIIQMK